MRSNLELLLLSLIRDGIGTPYELKAHADISLGSSVPALDRLKHDGLLSEMAEARRGRRFSLTTKGARALRHDWTEYLKNPSTDVDSALRIAYLAWLNGATEEAASYLEASAERLGGLVTMANAEVARFGTRRETVDNGAMRWLRARVETRRIEAEAAELGAIARELRSTSTRSKKKAAKKESRH